VFPSILDVKQLEEKCWYGWGGRYNARDKCKWKTTISHLSLCAVGTITHLFTTVYY